MENMLLDIKHFYVCDFYFTGDPFFNIPRQMIVEKEPMPLMAFIKRYGIPMIGFNRQLLDMLICRDMINTNVAIVMESNSLSRFFYFDCLSIWLAPGLPKHKECSHVIWCYDEETLNKIRSLAYRGYNHEYNFYPMDTYTANIGIYREEGNDFYNG